MTGRIVSTGDLEIEGEVDGIVDAARLKVGPHGRLRATIEADDAVVSGNMAGIIKARGVTFTDGCRFTGEVQYEQLGMEPEASVEGRLIPVVDGNARSHVGQTARTAPALSSDGHLQTDGAPATAGKAGRAKPRPVPRIPRHAAAVEHAPPRAHPWLTGIVVTVVLIASAVVGALYISPAARDWRSAMVEAVRDGKPAAPAPALAPAPGTPADVVSEPVVGTPPAAESVQPRDAAPPPKPAAPAESVPPTPPDVRTVAPAEPARQPDAARPAKADVPTPAIPIPAVPAPAVAAPTAPAPSVSAPAADPVKPPTAKTAPAAVEPPSRPAPAAKDPEALPVLPQPAAPAKPASAKPAPVAAPVIEAPVIEAPAVEKPAVTPPKAPASEPVAEPPAAPAPQDVTPVPDTKPPAATGAAGPAAGKPAAEGAGGTSSVRGSKPEEEGCQWVKQCDPDQPDRCVSVRRCGE